MEMNAAFASKDAAVAAADRYAAQITELSARLEETHGQATQIEHERERLRLDVGALQKTAVQVEANAQQLEQAHIDVGAQLTQCQERLQYAEVAAASAMQEAQVARDAKEALEAKAVADGLKPAGGFPTLGAECDIACVHVGAGAALSGATAAIGLRVDVGEDGAWHAPIGDEAMHSDVMVGAIIADLKQRMEVTLRARDAHKA